MNQTLLFLPGDGIGPEVIEQTGRIAQKVAPDLILEEAAIGGSAIDTEGTPFPETTARRTLHVDAVLLGAVGGPKWSRMERELRPEAGLLALRKHMDVYANLRPAFCFPALLDASSLKPELIRGLDILIIRELVGGIYFGQPRGIKTLENGERQGFDTQSYTSSEIRRIAHIAFEAVRKRGLRNSSYPGLLSVDKSNVLESGLLWREEVSALHQECYADIPLAHMYGDACAMQLLRAPGEFNVILADNLFGDVLSDEAAMLTGSIGMLPSASLGNPGTPGLYEPVHGSAPDIAGQNLANPCAAILSLGMALHHSLDLPEAASQIRNAVEQALEKGARTRDLGGCLSTAEMGNAILNSL